MPTFMDELGKRLKDTRVFEDRHAAAIARELATVRKTAVDKLAGLAPYTDPDTGAFIDNLAARRAVEAIIADIDRTAAQVAQAATAMTQDAKEFAFSKGALDAAYSMKKGTDADVFVGGSFAQIFREAAQASAVRPVLGTKASTQYAALSTKAVNDIRRTITHAVVSGESIGATTQAIVAATGISERAGVRIARTNLIAAMNEGHRAAYDANADIIDGYIWDSVMDARTSEICMALHGKFFPIGSIPPGPPAHPNCRSTLIPHFKDPDLNDEVDEAGKRVRPPGDEPGPEGDFDRGPQGGRLPDHVEPRGDFGFDEFLRGAPADAVDHMLGSETKGSLYRANKITLDDVVGPDLRRRTDPQVVERAWARAPDDPQLQSLGATHNVPLRPPEYFQNLDLKAARASPFAAGIDERTPAEIAARLERINELKVKKQRNAVAKIGEKLTKLKQAKLADRPSVIPATPKDYEESSVRVQDDAIGLALPILEKLRAKRKKNREEVGPPVTTKAQVREVLTANLKTILEKSALQSRVDPDVLEKILDGGRFKNQHETGTSHGLLNKGVRERFEKEVLGADKGPIYGYAEDVEGTAAVGQYGSVAVRLKERVKDQATITTGDTLDQRGSVAVPFRNPDSRALPRSQYDAFELEERLRAKTTAAMSGGRYIEAQMHGGVNADDIEEVVFHRGPPSEELKRKLKEKGIKWRMFRK